MRSDPLLGVGYYLGQRFGRVGVAEHGRDPAHLTPEYPFVGCLGEFQVIAERLDFIGDAVKHPLLMRGQFDQFGEKHLLGFSDG